MNSDTQRIEYAALHDECRRLNEQKYGNDKFLEEIKEDLKRLNEKIDDLVLVMEDNMKHAQRLLEIESIYLTV